MKWQGWVVLVVYFLLLLGGVQLFDPEVRILEYIAFVALISSILIGVSRARGESPPLALGQTVLKLAHLARCCC